MTALKINKVNITTDPEEVKVIQPAEVQKTPTAASIFLKATLLAISIAFIMLLVTAFAVGIWGFTRVQSFFTASGLSYAQTKEIITNGIIREPQHTNGVTTILLLGLDSLKTRPGSPQLTDTMMLVFINYDQSTITTLPLPRDIWSPEYQTKINALYHYGQERYPEEPERFTREVLSELTGTEIDYTVVITLEQVGTIIDMLGGVTVTIPQAFTDTQFPRTDVDVTVVTDPELLYETVSFDVGEQTLTGERALQYMRSRKSGDDQGDDTARGARQQLIVESLVATAQSERVLSNLTLIGELVKYYQNTFSKHISLSEGISIAWKLLQQPQNFTIISKSIPILPKDGNGLLSNPPIRKYALWVYEITDKEAFKNFIASLKKS